MREHAADIHYAGACRHRRTHTRRCLGRVVDRIYSNAPRNAALLLEKHINTYETDERNCTDHWPRACENQAQAKTDPDKRTRRQTHTNTDKQRQTKTDTGRPTQTKTNTERHRQTQTDTDTGRVAFVCHLNSCVHVIDPL